MQIVSDTYKNYLENALSLSPKSKIIVGDKEYLGDVIMATPKISHSNTSFIGGFPSKTCSFELYNPNNDIDLENKEIIVYRGLVIDGAIEWVKQGVFIPQATNITNDITTRKYKVNNALDKRQLLDVLYVSSLDWSTTHTGLEIVNDALKDTGVSLESENFNWAEYSFEQPNFPSNATKTEVISRIAEIGGEIALFNSNGNLVIKSQTATGDTIPRKRYTKLTKENEYMINTLVLGKEGADDDIVYQNTDMINAPIGKNIFNFEKWFNNGVRLINGIVEEITNKSITITANANDCYTDNTYHMNTTASENNINTVKKYGFEIEPNTEYTFSFDRTGTTAVDAFLFCYDANYNYVSHKSWITKGGRHFTTITTPVNAKYMCLRIDNDIAGNTITYSNFAVKKGNDSTYEEYIKQGIKEWKMLDNPYVDLNRESMISLVAPYIIGKSYTPYELTDFVDGFIYELNDTLSVVDKNGDTFTAVILEYDSLSRIKSNVKAQKANSNNTNYKIAGSVKEQLAKVRFEVDHINNEIRSIVSKGYVNEEDLEVLRQSLVTQNEESITMSFNTLTEIMNSANAETQKQFQEQSKYIRFDGGISLGEVGNEVTLRIENETIYFSVSDVKIMEITPNGIKIEKVITDEIDMGDFSLIIEEDGSLSLV